MTDITAADVREALFRMADSDDFCACVSRRLLTATNIGYMVSDYVVAMALDRAAMAAEARTEGDR